MGNDEMSYERELRIVDVLVHILRKWKKVVLAAGIGAVVLVAYVVLSTMNQEPTLVMSSAEIAEAEARVEEIKVLVTTAEEAVKANEDAIVVLESSIETNELSVLDKENEIERIEKSIGKSKDLEVIYQTMVDDMMATNIVENGTASEMMNCIVKLADTQDTIYSKESRIVTLNREIRELKKANEITIPKQIEEIEEQKIETEKEIELLNEESVELVSQIEKKITQEFSVTKVIVFAVIGLILGLSVSCGYIVALMMFDNKIHNVQTVEDCFGLYYLGTLSYAENGVKNNIFSKLIGKIRGTERARSMAEEKDVIVSKVKTFSKTNKVIAVSTLCEDDIQNAMNELKTVALSSGIEFIVAGNPVYNADALRKLKDYEVVLIEKVDVTKVNELANLIRLIQKSESAIVGAVVL